MFNPSDFLDLARELGKNNEAKIRTAVGRAYYASFLTARNAFAINEKTPQAHRLVVSMLYSKNPVTAIELYKSREVSLSKAAEIAGMNIEDFKRVLSDRGVKREIKPDTDIDKKVEEIMEWRG
jgi:uncharacterized protein (UPF0332 family)